MAIQAVISGDIVGSTKLPVSQQEEVWQNLQFFGEIMGKAGTMNPLFDRTSLLPQVDFEVSRGDFVQSIVSPPELVLRLALLIRTYLNASDFLGEFAKPFPGVYRDIRLAVGLGPVEHLRQRVITSDGEAFHYSGRLLDELKREPRIRIGFSCRDESLTRILETDLALLEVQWQHWTDLQKRIAHFKLLGYTQTEMADKLNVAQPNISRAEKSMGWWATQQLINLVENQLIPAFTKQHNP